MVHGRRTHLRIGDQADHRVQPMELFFDLVFVFAVTQLSHYLLEHLSLSGALQTTAMFLAVWWAWMYTAWATNWLDPDRAPVRLILASVMLGSLVLAATMTEAFGKYGLAFALAYCAIQIGRTFYTAWARGEWRRGASKNLTRAAFYFVASAPKIRADEIAAALIVVIAVWEWGSFHGGWAERIDRVRKGQVH